MQIPIVSQLLGDLSITQSLLVLLLVLAVSFYVYATSYHGTWEKLGVPGPKPWPIIDHKLEIGNSPQAAISKWFKLYGNTFGVYGLLPRRATLITKDLNLVKQILVKDFENFVDRSRPRKTTTSLRFGLTSTTGESWKRTRTVTSPMFTGSRMKTILRHVTASAETLTQLTKQKTTKGELIPLKLFVAKFATEVIARIGFGLQSHAISDNETEFAYHARNLIKFDSPFLKCFDKVYQYFPQIETICRLLHINTDFISKKADKYFINILNSTITERTKGRKSEKARDMLDMLINAGMGNNDLPKELNTKGLSHDEIIGNSTMLILAGVETVSTAFQSILYCLALYPEIQDKVVAEIDRVFPDGLNVEYEQLSDLKYTEQVVNECLRMFPLISIILRIAAETKTYGKITIPKGCYIQIPLGEIMKDPENWPDPEKFDPERFSPENKAGRDPLAFMPFGYGPRICLGMRLAMMELKIILTYLLKEVKFTLSERTVPKRGETLKMKTLGLIAQRPENEIQLEPVWRV